MIEKINSGNYESYYLDYLEGSLDDATVHILLEFLDVHPEFKLESEELAFLSPDTAVLNDSFKNELKQIDLERTLISLNNLDTFCIAFHENQLNIAKKKELYQFISVLPQLEETLNLYGKVKLIPNTSLVYENKLALKQSRIKPLFPIISVAASALIVFFGYQVWKNPNYGESGAVLKRTEMSAKRVTKPRILDAHKNANELFRDTNESNFNHIPQNLIENQENDRFITQIRRVNNKLEIDNLKTRIPNLEMLAQSLEIENTPEQIIVPRMVEQENYRVAAIEMKNPIKPVTKRLSAITKTQIDYRTARAVDKTKKGFFIKIGNFEVSRM